jgi:ABC-2 type transport system ATP-binding protein
MAKRLLPVVQTAGLCKTFKDFWRRPRVEAVKDLNLEIYPGEILGLLGPNGSGKTTTIKMLLGLLYPTRGRISLFGKPPTDVAVKARIGFLPEESYLYRFLVASETLDYYGRLFRLPAHVRHDRTDKLLDMVGLRHEARRPLGEYSKGMARRIGLAQALINDPEFLILDEPTSGLDPIGARQIKDVIRELGRKGKTILLSSHVLADVEDVCDRVVILYGGQQRAAGSVGTLLARTDATQITTPALTDDTIEEIRAVVRRREGKDLTDVSYPRQKLEEFFLQIVHEAQRARVRTSGAMVGGELPSFLTKATESATHEVIDSLVAAASAPTATPPAIPEPTAPRPAEAADDVIQSLLSRPEESEPASGDEEGGEVEATAEAEARTSADDAGEGTGPPRRPRAKVKADSEVLDALLGTGEPPQPPRSEN